MLPKDMRYAFELGFQSDVLGLVADSERNILHVHCQPLNLDPQSGSPFRL